MGDHAIDAHSMGHPLIKCARNNLDPRSHHKLEELGLHFTHGHHKRNSRSLGASSGLIGEKAGATSVFDEPRPSSGFGPQQAYKPTPADAGVPAGCVSGRVGGRAGEMGDYGIDAYAMSSPLHKSARNNVDPRHHHKMDRHNPRASVMGGRERPLGATAGLPGQRNGGNAGSDAGQSVTSSRSMGALPRTLADEGIPAGCVSSRVAGRGGEMGDHGIDAYAVSSALHKSARSNVDPREHHKMTRHNPRASVSMGKAPGLGASAGCIGEKAGTTYHGAEASPFAHTMTPRADSHFGYAPQPRSARKNSNSSVGVSRASSCCAGMPFSHSRCHEVTDFTRSLAKGHTGVRTMKLN